MEDLSENLEQPNKEKGIVDVYLYKFTYVKLWLLIFFPKGVNL